jgi:hypothetical protein
MREIWIKACQEAGEDIEMYSGLKHSSCSQYINEKGYSLDEVQMLTDHARRDSVKRYASVQLDAKRRLLEGKQGRGVWLRVMSQSIIKYGVPGIRDYSCP